MNRQIKTDIFETLSYLTICFFFCLLLWSATIPWLCKSQQAHTSTHVLVSGKHFAEDGFIPCKFLPIWQPGKIYPGPKEFYTHYPPLPSIINGLLRKLGFSSLLAFRFPSGLAITLALLLWYLFLRDLYNSQIAFYALFFLAALPEFFIGSIAPVGYSLDQLFRFATIYLTFKLFSSRTVHRRNLYISLWLLMFFQSLTTYEYTLYLQLYVWGYVLLFKPESFKNEKKNFLGLLWAPVCGILLHLLQNVWALGFSGALADLTGIFKYRTGIQGIGYPNMLLESIKILIWNYLTIFGIANNKILRIILVVVAISSLSELKRFREITHFWKHLFLFFICDVSWYFLFPQHAQMHVHPLKSLMPSTTFFIGVLLYLNIGRLRRLINSKNSLLSLKYLTVLSLFFLLYSYKISGMVESLKTNFTPPTQYEYRLLKKFIPEDAICLTNLFEIDSCICFIRYYLDRRTYPCRVPMINKARKFLKANRFLKHSKLFYVCYDPIIGRTEKKSLSAGARLIARKKDISIYQIPI